VPMFGTYGWGRKGLGGDAFSGVFFLVDGGGTGGNCDFVLELYPGSSTRLSFKPLNLVGFSMDRWISNLDSPNALSSFDNQRE
jgi:hypothetical protein